MKEQIDDLTKAIKRLRRDQVLRRQIEALEKEEKPPPPPTDKELHIQKLRGRIKELEKENASLNEIVGKLRQVISHGS